MSRHTAGIWVNINLVKKGKTEFSKFLIRESKMVFREYGSDFKIAVPCANASSVILDDWKKETRSYISGIDSANGYDSVGVNIFEDFVLKMQRPQKKDEIFQKAFENLREHFKSPLPTEEEKFSAKKWIEDWQLAQKQHKQFFTPIDPSKETTWAIEIFTGNNDCQVLLAKDQEQFHGIISQAYKNNVTFISKSNSRNTFLIYFFPHSGPEYIEFMKYIRSLLN